MLASLVITGRLTLTLMRRLRHSETSPHLDTWQQRSVSGRHTCIVASPPSHSPTRACLLSQHRSRGVRRLLRRGEGPLLDTRQLFDSTKPRAVRFLSSSSRTDGRLNFLSLTLCEVLGSPQQTQSRKEGIWPCSHSSSGVPWGRGRPRPGRCRPPVNYPVEQKPVPQEKRNTQQPRRSPAGAPAGLLHLDLARKVRQRFFCRERRKRKKQPLKNARHEV